MKHHTPIRRFAARSATTVFTVGQTIKLRFTGIETLGGGYNTSFFEDDNALNVS